MLGWEQAAAGQLLHAYAGHASLPVCDAPEARRSYDDKVPRTMYVGPMPPPDEMICQACKVYERDRDPMFIAGRKHEREVITGALSREANRIYREQAQDYPSNVLDTVALNLMVGELEQLSVRKT